MSVFDQRGQRVNYQYNAAGDINFGTVENRVDLVTELEKLKGELTTAAAAQAIDADVAEEAKLNVSMAVLQAKKPDADKKKIVDYLNTAKTVLNNVAAAGGLVAALVKAAELAQKFF